MTARATSPLTIHQTLTLALIAARQLTQSPFPSLREIALEIGAKDKTTAARIVQTLRRRELIGAAT